MKYLLISLTFLFIACQGEKEITAKTILDDAVEAHGLNALEGKKIEFDFRDKHYSLLRESSNYTYTRSFQDSLGYVEDILVNSADFTRKIAGNKFEVDAEWSGKYASSVNSVLYFVQLPFVLRDGAAMKDYQGLVKIKGKDYYQIEVRFQEADGGEDFEDVFLYWFEKESLTMDYLAYSYITEGGGVRFREAFNRTAVGGIVFQDYINYKPAEKETPLVQMKALFESDELIELSRIENINISVDCC